VTDAYNNKVADWTNPTRVTEPARLEQTAATEVTVDRDTLVSDWLLFSAADSAIEGHKRVEARGSTFEVVGKPALFYDRSSPHHYETRLRLIEG
jgi:hypothetical protein